MSKNIISVKLSLHNLSWIWTFAEWRHEPGKGLASPNKPNKHLTFNLNFHF